jgi:hypothetical protein
MTKRIIAISIFCLFATVAFSQEKGNWNNTFIYAIRLPAALANSEGVKATILYKGKILQPKKILIGGKLVSQPSSFFYSIRGTNTVYGLALPIAVPANCFIWLFDSDMLIEMTNFPNRYQINISTTDGDILKKYSVPVTFDFIPDNALNVTYLKSMGQKKATELLLQKTWLMSIETKLPNITVEERDTTLLFSLRNSLPKGVETICTGINKQAKANQEFVFTNCYLYKKTLFFPYTSNPSLAKIKAPINHPDICKNKMIDVWGNTCATSGCITGFGAGNCSGLNKNNAVAYKVTIIIEP